MPAVFVLTLVFVELLVRGPLNYYLPIDDDIVYRWKASWLASQRAHDVVLLGDSTAHQGLSPVALAHAGLPGAINIASPSATGTVLSSYAQIAKFRSREVVFGSHATALLDTPLQNHERYLWPLTDPSLWPPLSADLVLSRFWRTFSRRKPIHYTLLAALGSLAPHRIERFDFSSWQAQQDPAGFLVTAQAPATPKERSQQAELYAERARAALSSSHGFRVRSLVKALEAWRAPGGRVTLLVTPEAAATVIALEAVTPWARLAVRWQEVARAVGAKLLDCRRMLPDDEMIDFLHPTPTGAERLSEGLARYIKSGVTPPGCSSFGEAE